MSPKELGRPQDENEFRLREAVGTIRASRFVREYAKSSRPITIEVVTGLTSFLIFDRISVINTLIHYQNGYKKRYNQ